MTSVRRASLAQVFFLAALAIALVVTLSFWLFLRDSRASILSFSARVRENAARRVDADVVQALDAAKIALEDVARGIGSGAVDADDPRALEVQLFSVLLNSPRLAEVTFTRAALLGYDAEGEARLADSGRVQLSTYREAQGAIVSRLTARGQSGFVVRARARKPGGTFDSAPFEAHGAGVDPTLHPTFNVPMAEPNAGRALWSDLHYSELDSGQTERRVVLSVQRAVSDPNGHVLGVVRVALLTTDLDTISKIKVDPTDPADPHRIALLAVASSGAPDAQLVARIGPKDRIQLVGDDLRIVPDHPPPEIAALLSSPLVHGLNQEHPNADGALTVNGERYLVTLRELSGAGSGTAGWLVAVLVPESRVTKDLVRFERLFLTVFGATLLAVLSIGIVTLRFVQNGLRQVVATTADMRGFDFAPDRARSRLLDIDEVMLGLERAKTVVRAMGKYIPLDLVRRLYESNEEPQLGGDLRRVSLMFTDIEGFTTLAERLPPDHLAQKLGEYLEAMTSAVERTSGTIDKYIGDAVMAFWNAPVPVENHAARACEAVLACQEAVQTLYASPAWNGLPPLVTRFGLHTAEVMVGHFGARSRLSYTALGDGVNLAARLEPLCKQYGVTVLVSEAIAAAASAGFVFRRVDRVAVKGKLQSIEVFELLGRKGQAITRFAQAQRYEVAFQAYLQRDFERAASLLENADDDPPSSVLKARCEQLRVAPPPADWGGVHVAKSK